MVHRVQGRSDPTPNWKELLRQFFAPLTDFHVSFGEEFFNLTDLQTSKPPPPYFFRSKKCIG